MTVTPSLAAWNAVAQASWARSWEEAPAPARSPESWESPLAEESLPLPLSRMMPSGGRRACTRSIHVPDRAVSAARLSIG